MQTSSNLIKQHTWKTFSPMQKKLKLLLKYWHKFSITGSSLSTIRLIVCLLLLKLLSKENTYNLFTIVFYIADMLAAMDNIDIVNALLIIIN